MTPSDVRDLIAKLEAASAENIADDDWVIDATRGIADACFAHSDTVDPGNRHWWFSGWHAWQPIEDAPDWLHSLDAALSLVPEGWSWMAKSADDCPRGPIRPSAAVHQRGSDPPVARYAFAATPVLALVIACLKARFPDAQ